MKFRKLYFHDRNGWGRFAQTRLAEDPVTIKNILEEVSVDQLTTSPLVPQWRQQLLRGVNRQVIIIVHEAGCIARTDVGSYLTFRTARYVFIEFNGETSRMRLTHWY
jgi:hypothetical protein